MTEDEIERLRTAARRRERVQPVTRRKLKLEAACTCFMCGPKMLTTDCAGETDGGALLPVCGD